MNTNILGKSFIDKENAPHTFNANVVPNQKFPRKSVCDKPKRLDVPIKTLDGNDLARTRGTLRSKDALNRSPSLILIPESSLLQPKPQISRPGRDRAVSIQENPGKLWNEVPKKEGKLTQRFSDRQENSQFDYASVYKRSEGSRLLEAYGEDIFASLSNKQQEFPVKCLERHKIPSNLRARMVDWMIEVLSSYKCQHQTFFVAVNLMDKFFDKTKTLHSVSELHLTGVTCMFLACKYEEIYPVKLQVVYEKIAHKKLSLESIKAKEQEILAALDFNIITGSLIELLALVYGKLNFEDPQNKKKDYLEKICIYLSKMVMHDYELLNTFTPLQLSSGVLYIGFKILEQVNKGFHLKDKTLEIERVLGVPSETVSEAATKVLALAKNFEKDFPNLENLKKFNGFYIDIEEGLV